MKALQYAIAAALALPAATAFAVDPVVGTFTPPVVLRVGGATASDNTLKNLFALNPADADVAAVAPCQAGSMDVYFSGSITSQGDYLISCLSTANVAGVTVGTHIAIVKETAGGSLNGILQVARQTNLNNFITPTQANVATCVAVTNGGGVGELMAFGQWDCNPATAGFYTPAPPHVGISDVDPATAIGTAGVVTSDATALTATPGLQVLFAPIVSLALRDRLQDLQFPGGECDNATTERETLACIPTLSSSVLAGIFSNSIDDWNQVEIGGQRVGDAYGSQPARVCRRADTSGTQTSFKLHYLNEGCNTKAAASAFVAPDDSNCVLANCAFTAAYQDDRVFAGGGSGNVRDCVNFNSTTEYRLGVASTESKPNFAAGATTNRFRYVRVDGQEPTLWATQQGKYNFFTENTLNTRVPDATPVGSRPIWTFIKNRIGVRAAVTGANSAFTDAACTSPTTGECDTGVLVRPVAYDVEPTWPLAAGNLRLELQGPVNTQTRTKIGEVAPNNCNTPFRVLPGAGN